MALTQDVIDEPRIGVDAERLVECLFGEGAGEDLVDDSVDDISRNHAPVDEITSTSRNQ